MLSERLKIRSPETAMPAQSLPSIERFSTRSRELYLAALPRLRRIFPPLFAAVIVGIGIIAGFFAVRSMDPHNVRTQPVW